MTAMLFRSMRSFAWNAGCAILTPSAFASPLRATMQPSFDDRTTAGRPSSAGRKTRSQETKKLLQSASP